MYGCTVVRKDAKRNWNRRNNSLFCDIFIISSISIGGGAPWALPLATPMFERMVCLLIWILIILHKRLMKSRNFQTSQEVDKIIE